MHVTYEAGAIPTTEELVALYESLGFVETRDWPEGEQTRSFMRLNDCDVV